MRSERIVGNPKQGRGKKLKVGRHKPKARAKEKDNKTSKV